MTFDEIKTTLNTLLMDSSGLFSANEPDLFIQAAVRDLSRVKPRIERGELDLIANNQIYDAPQNMLRPMQLLWGLSELQTRQPWDDDFPGQLPRLLTCYESGSRKLMLSPAPSARLIGLLGAVAPFTYTTPWVLGTDINTTIEDADENLILIRALAEAMLAIANRGIHKPVTLGGKAGLSMPKNGTPAALAEQYLALFERWAGS